jgi:hypothetical protein
MKWYWWLIIVIVPLGFVAYFFYKAGANKDKMATVRAGKNKPDSEKTDSSIAPTHDVLATNSEKEPTII